MKSATVLLMGVMSSALASSPPHQLRAVTRSLSPHLGQLRALFGPDASTPPPTTPGTNTGTCSAGAAAVGSCCTDGAGQPNSQFSIAGFDTASLNDCYEFAASSSIVSADNIFATVNSFNGLKLGSSASSLAVYTADKQVQSLLWLFSDVQVPSLSSNVSSAADAASGNHSVYACLDFPAQDPAAFPYAIPPTGGETSASGLPTTCHKLDTNTLVGAAFAAALYSDKAAMPGVNVAAMYQTGLLDKFVTAVESLLRNDPVNSQPITSACGCGAVAATAVHLAG